MPWPHFERKPERSRKLARLSFAKDLSARFEMILTRGQTRPGAQGETKMTKMILPECQEICGP